MTFEETTKACGIIAILRGITLDEVAGVGDALYEAGSRIVEVPLNSPEPLRSITALAARFQGRMIVGAGTVLDTESVDRVSSAGGQISATSQSTSQRHGA
jgi:2-dehydro-3-deoxyphosphogalactonate aldolase